MLSELTTSSHSPSAPGRPALRLTPDEASELWASCCAGCGILPHHAIFRRAFDFAGAASGGDAGAATRIFDGMWATLRLQVGRIERNWRPEQT